MKTFEDLEFIRKPYTPYRSVQVEFENGLNMHAQRRDYKYWASITAKSGKSVETRKLTKAEFIELLEEAQKERPHFSKFAKSPDKRKSKEVRVNSVISSFEKLLEEVKNTDELTEDQQKAISALRESKKAIGLTKDQQKAIDAFRKEAKNDRIDNKVRWELMPLELLNEVAKVYTAGAEKYGANTWQNLEDGYERYKGALLRHLLANETEDLDSESGAWHLAQVAWNALSMLYFKMKKNGK